MQDTSARYTGAVVMFERRSNGNWTQQAYIKAEHPGRDDEFGSSVSLSADGKLLVVGAMMEDSVAVGINGDATDNSRSASGCAYTFEREGDSWTQKAYIKPSFTETGDNFGSSVSANGDGSVVVIGGRGETGLSASVNGDQTRRDLAVPGVGPGVGAAYVLSKPARIAAVPPFESNSVLFESSLTTTSSSESTLNGGAIAGIVVVALAPFVVALIVWLSYVAHKRRQVLKSAELTSSNPVVAALLTVLVVLLALAGLALVAYALYDYLSFASGDRELIFDAVIERLESISAWEGEDCSISDNAELAGKGACLCYVDDGSGLWNCTEGNRVESSQDCQISSSPFCSCSLVYKGSPPSNLWTCEKRSVALQFDNSTSEVDLALRFLPPRYSDQLYTTAAQLATLPENVASFDSFYLLFAEPVPDTTPISIALLVSLGFDFAGLLILAASVVVFFLKWKGKLSKQCCVMQCGEMKLRVFTVIDFFFLFSGLVLFGVVLIVAYTNPIFFQPQTTVQRIELGNDVNSIAVRFTAHQGEKDSNICKCPYEYEGGRCAVENNELVFEGDTEFDRRSSVFSCNVTVRNGKAVFSETTMFSRDVTVVSGDVVINAGVVIEGTLTVGSGNVSGTAFDGATLESEPFKIGGDLVIEAGWLVCGNSSSAHVPVQGKVKMMAGGLDYIGNELHLTGYVQKGIQFETSVPLTIPPSLR